nr:hypothetical protein [Tanacetum cinerariifolium]
QLSKSDSDVLPSVFDSRSSDGDDNPTNDRPTSNKASALISKGEPSVIKTSNISVEMPKVDSVRTSGVIIEDWVSDDADTLVDTQLKREYDSWVNERQMQKTEEKVDTSKALDASSVDTESNIRLIYDEEPMAEVQTTAEINVFAIGQQHTEQPEFNNEGEVVQNAEECHDTCPLPAIEREAASAKPHHMIASSNSRISSKNMIRFSSNDMVDNHYLEEAKKRTQKRSRNSKPSLMPSARSQSTANVGLRWVPTGKIFASSTTKVDSEPLNGSNADITNQYECEQTLDVSAGFIPQRQKELDYDNPDPVPQRQDVYSSADADDPSQQELDMLFGSNPSTNIQSTSAPSTHTHVNAEENNNDQAEEGEHIPNDEFTNPFCALTHKVAESSSHNIGNSNVPTFNQPQVSEYRWTKDHPLEQVRRNPSRPVQTRRQLATDLEMCMYILTVSSAEPKNIKEAMADSARIEAMQDELHQFDRLQVWELVDKPFSKSIIRLKWLWKNKKDEDQTVIRNKARLVAKGYAQEEGIDFEESFALGSSFELRAFLDADDARCIDSRKSTSGGIQFL